MTMSEKSNIKLDVTKYLTEITNIANNVADSSSFRAEAFGAVLMYLLECSSDNLAEFLDLLWDEIVDTDIETIEKFNAQKIARKISDVYIKELVRKSQ